VSWRADNTVRERDRGAWRQSYASFLSDAIAAGQASPSQANLAAALAAEATMAGALGRLWKGPAQALAGATMERLPAAARQALRLARASFQLKGPR
jgi:hypothetical protein